MKVDAKWLIHDMFVIVILLILSLSILDVLLVMRINNDFSG